MQQLLREGSIPRAIPNTSLLFEDLSQLLHDLVRLSILPAPAEEVIREQLVHDGLLGCLEFLSGSHSGSSL